jgi:DNA-binding LacI/PurR family transcriptional regulator
LILLGPELPGPRLAELGRRAPVVVVGRRVREETVHAVRSADDEGMRQAVEHLVALGHTMIVHVDGGATPKAADRRRGYRLTMRRNGLAGSVRIIQGGQTSEEGAAAAQKLLEEPLLPTAVVVFNDDCAYGILDTFLRAGIVVPSDVSLVGYDDSRLSRLPPVNLTTVGQDAAQMAGLAVERAVALLGGEEVADREVVIAPHLVVRGTTAAVPATDIRAAT